MESTMVWASGAGDVPFSVNANDASTDHLCSANYSIRTHL